MKKTKQLTLTAVLTAAALVVFVIESQLPPLTAVPGIKLGLANIFTLFALYAVGTPWAFALLLVRVLLGCAITGQMMALIYSLAGGLLAFGTMWLASRRIGEAQLWVVSVLGAGFHNVGQLAAAIFVTNTPELLYYAPVLMISAVITGAFTGLCAQLVLKQLRRNGFFK